MTIVITAASGRTSTHVIKALLGKGGVPPSDLRLFVHYETDIDKVRQKFPQLSKDNFVVGDFLEASTLPPAFKGADIVFFNSPAFHPLETAMGIAAVEAASDAGVKHFVLCSVLFPILTKLLNHKAKLGIEEHLIESGLNYTILEPTSFMQNINVQDIVKSSVLRAPYNPKTLQGFVDLNDLAEIVTKIIANPEVHNRARYELVGENATLEEVGKIIGRAIGSVPDAIKCEAIPREKLLESGALPIKIDSLYIKEGLDRMLYYYDRRGIPGNNNTVRWLLQREPTNWKAHISRELKL